MPQVANISAGPPARLATFAGVKKMPTPMMPPMTTQATSKTPSSRRWGGESIEVFGEVDDQRVEREVGVEALHTLAGAVQQIDASVRVDGQRDAALDSHCDRGIAL